MFFPDRVFHSTEGEPVTAPLADGPRICGQFTSAAQAAMAKKWITLSLIPNHVKRLLTLAD